MIQRLAAILWVTTAFSFAGMNSQGPFTSLDGKPVPLFGDDKLVLLDFWASWCIPCRMAVPEVNQIAKDYPNLRVVGVNADDPADFEKARRFIKSTKMSYPSIVDIPEKVSDALRVEAIPTLILLDSQGREIQRWVGAPVNLKEQVRSAIAAKN